MMKLSDAFPSKYLKATDIEKPTIVTMTTVKLEELGQGEDIEIKPVLYFEEFEKGLVLNKTNSTTIADLHGDDVDGLVGNKITLFTMFVEFRGKMTNAIRVEPVVPKVFEEQQARRPADDDDSVPF